MNLLHIDSSLREQNSWSREFSRATVDRFLQLHPEAQIDYLDLLQADLPHIDQEYAQAMYLLPEQYTAQTESTLALSNALVKRFKQADVYVIGVPMYNFTIPSVLKSLIDHVVRSEITFTVTDTGYQGLLEGKRAIILNARGGSYTEAPASSMDFVADYMRAILGFIGVTDVTFIPVEPTLFYGEEAADRARQEVLEKINTLT